MKRVTIDRLAYLIDGRPAVRYSGPVRWAEVVDLGDGKRVLCKHGYMRSYLSDIPTDKRRTMANWADGHRCWENEIRPIEEVKTAHSAARRYARKRQ